MGWTEEKLTEHIQLGIEESLTLDYKSALALDNSKKQEITKDVSSMANSAGGTIIYGITEDLNNRHLPGKIDPVDRTKFSREWLEQVINNIQPRIEGITISSISISGEENHVVYVVDIPQSDTAHQSTDMKYYKRFNFMSVPMYDYEIRDVMSRGKSSHLSVELVRQENWHGVETVADEAVTGSRLFVFLKNGGKNYARFVSGFITLPTAILTVEEHQKYCQKHPQLLPLYQWNLATLCKQVDALPLLPGTSALLLQLDLNPNLHTVLQNMPNAVISWMAYADNSPVRKGKLRLSSIPKDFKDVMLFAEG